MDRNILGHGKTTAFTIFIECLNTLLAACFRTLKHVRQDKLNAALKIIVIKVMRKSAMPTKLT